MRTAIGILVVLCGLAARIDAQCCGDCDRSGDVTIDELITAVNNALDGCTTPTRGPKPTATPRPTATPTNGNQCGVAFTDNSAGSCTFSGHFNQGCGNELTSTFASDGSTLVVTINTQLNDPPFVSFAAQVTSATEASLTSWSTDNFQTTNHPTAGTVQLTDNGTSLVIFPNDPPFMILG